MKINKDYQIKNIITYFFVTATIITLIITMISVIMLNQREIKLIRENNLEKTHDILSHLIAPAVDISDGTAIIRQLSLASDKNQFFVVVDNNSDIFFPGANDTQLVQKYFEKKRKNLICNNDHTRYKQIDGINYWIKCSNLVSTDLTSDKNIIGILFSFSKNILLPTFSLSIYAFGIALLIIFLIGFFFRSFLSKYLLNPLIQLSAYIQNNEKNKQSLNQFSHMPLEIKMIKDKFEELLINLESENNKRVEYEKKGALFELAAQVAHDMRSPLLAAYKFFHLIENRLDESERIFGKRAMLRLDDIARSLLARYKNKEEVKNANSYVFLYSSLLELLAEKRMEYLKNNIEFDIKISPEDAFSLVFINPVQLKRMLSNVINNAVNAISPQNGLIEILMERNIAGTLIFIRDNGKGMSFEKTNEILSHARSKKKRTNLGLPHAIQFLDDIGGNLEIVSEEGKGSTVTISFPACTEPDWCLEEYYTTSNDFILIIDDNQSVHDVWNEMFKKMSTIDFTYKHLYQPDEAFAFFHEFNEDKPLIIFCDYEFFESNVNGIAILDKAPKNAIKVLVTSHLYDQHIMQTAIDSSVKLLPKDLLPYFKLLKKSFSAENPDDIRLIFIDNERRNTESWKFFAEFKKLKIATYNDVDDFLKDAALFNKKIPVYIDLNLDRDKNGIDYAKEISDAGFGDIYIATGAINMDLKITNYPWLKGIIEKQFPM